ncbi:MAG: hypothetical protein ABR947_02270 [Solirubrobacteraceae bacterium]|jgi:hypothetical protein
MKPRSKRAVAVAGVAIVAAVILAACGGSSPTTTTTTTSSSAAANATPSSNAAAPAGAGQFAATRAKLAACLKKYGVTLPSFAGAGRFAGATGGAGALPRRFGATGATGRRFLGATGARGFPGAGRFPAGGGFASNPAYAKAFAKCGGFSGFGGGRFGATGAAGFHPAVSAQYRAEIVRYAACMSSNGEKLPKPDFTGRYVFGTSVNQRSATFVAANAKCKTLLTPTAPAGG